MAKRKTKHEVAKKWVRLTEVLLGVVLITGAFLIFHSPTAKKAAEESKGSIEVSTTPEKASIYLDGQLQPEKSNTTLSTSVGAHTIKLHLDGYDDQEVHVDVRSDVAAPVEHVFTVHG